MGKTVSGLTCPPKSARALATEVSDSSWWKASPDVTSPNSSIRKFDKRSVNSTSAYQPLIGGWFARRARMPLLPLSHQKAPLRPFKRKAKNPEDFNG